MVFILILLVLSIGLSSFYAKSRSNSHDSTHQMGLPTYILINREKSIDQTSIGKNDNQGNDDGFEISLKESCANQKAGQTINKSTGTYMIKRTGEQPNKEIGKEVTL